MMSKNFMVINICIVLFFFSCTFTHKKSESVTLSEYYDKINDLDKNNTVQINRLDGETISLFDISISNGSISGKIDQSDSLIILKISDVKSITYHNHLKGAIGGFAISFALSLTARLLQYTLWAPKETGEGAWPLIEFMYVPAIGGGIGAVVGTIISEKNEYVIINNDK